MRIEGRGWGKGRVREAWSLELGRWKSQVLSTLVWSQQG